MNDRLKSVGEWQYIDERIDVKFAVNCLGEVKHVEGWVGVKR